MVTDDWKNKKHPHLGQTYKPNAIVDTTSRSGKQRDRTSMTKMGVWPYKFTRAITVTHEIIPMEPMGNTYVLVG